MRGALTLTVLLARPGVAGSTPAAASSAHPARNSRPPGLRGRRSQRPADVPSARRRSRRAVQPDGPSRRRDGADGVQLGRGAAVRELGRLPAGQRDSSNVGGVPTDFSATDQVVGLAAQRGLTVLPTVLYAPGWDAGKNRSGGLRPPSGRARTPTILTALIRRYGPHGSFWQAEPSAVPIRMWQIWNEPNLTVLLAAAVRQAATSSSCARRTARSSSADPERQGRARRADEQRLEVPRPGRSTSAGRAELFDVISVNGFTSTPKPRDHCTWQLVRRAANQLGDKRKPLLATELSWPSAKGKSPQHFDWNTTEAGQARNIAALLPMLAPASKVAEPDRLRLLHMDGG